MKIQHLLLYLLLLGLGLTGIACQDIDFLAEPTATPPPPTATAVPTATPLPPPDSAAGFALFLAQVEAERSSDRQEPVNRYLAQIESAPLTDGRQAIFLWQGSAQKVQLAGDMNNWDLNQAPEFTRLDGADLWYLQAEYERDARLDYRLVVDGRWQLDPLNPQTIAGGFGPNSELTMPAYERPAELEPGNDIPAGTVTSHEIQSAILNQNRTIFVYTPPGQLVGEKWPSFYFHDGSDYLNLIDTPAILDRLVAQRQIPPLVAVFIPPINRNQEYDGNENYIRFIADEVVPFVQSSYDTDPSPARTGIGGASLGGLAAVHAAARRPDIFGLVLGQSGAFSVGNDALISTLAELPRQPIELYLVVGTYETAVDGSSTEGNLLAANQRLVAVLMEKNYRYAYVERPEGHSWGLWQGTLGAGLAFLLE